MEYAMRNAMRKRCYYSLPHGFAASCVTQCAEHAETMRHDDIEATLQGMILDLETKHETKHRKPCVTHGGTDAQDSAKAYKEGMK